MIVTVVVMRCDSCGIHLGDAPDYDDYEGGWSIFSDGNEAWQAARGEDWSTDGHKHYCPSCWTAKRRLAAEAARPVTVGDRS